MAKKDSQKRLILPYDLWELKNFSDFDRHEFGFFIIDDSRVVIAPIKTSGKIMHLPILGKCTFDEKHRFFVPRNVDNYLGEGDEYYFTVELSLPNPLTKSIFLYKVNRNSQMFKQDYHMRKLLENLS